MKNLSWPSDQRCIKQTAIKAGRKERSRTAVAEHEYPFLEPGSINALTLTLANGRYEWEGISRTLKPQKLLPQYMAKNIFPATRSLPLSIGKTTSSQRAEQGANFLRTYLPDIEIPAELIREAIEADMTLSRELKRYDSFAGNSITSIQCHNDMEDHPLFLCFPMGETNQELNLSRLIPSSEGNDRKLEPVAKSLHHFQTPITQITPSQYGDALAVRTLASVSLISVKIASDSMEPHLMEMAAIDSNATEKRPIMDVKLSSALSAAVFVNDKGTAYKRDFGNGCNSMQKIHSNPGVNQENFWKLSVTENNAGCALTSSKEVTYIDWRIGPACSQSQLFSAQDRKDTITSVEGSYEDYLIRLCTTTELLVIDRRFPRSPLLGVKHERAIDRTLETQTILFPTPMTFLTSRKNGLITVYDISRNESSLIRMNRPPYSLPSLSTYAGECNGHHFLPHLADVNRNRPGLMVYQLGDRGDIYSLNLEFPPDTETQPEKRPVVAMWTPDIQELAIRGSARADAGTLGPRDVTETDFQPVFDKLWNSSFASEDTNDTVDKAADAFDAMRTHWLEETPSDHMLTLFDVAFQSSQEPLVSMRSQFLTRCDVNNSEGFKVVSRGEIFDDLNAGGAPWHLDIKPTLQKIGLDIPPSAHVMHSQMQQYDLTRNPNTVHTLEAEAREQLVVDLALSTDVFSPRSFRKVARHDLNDLETMSRAAEAMSLGDEPLPVQLGYLENSNEDDNPSHELPCTIGVQLLLKEWEVGSDPGEYVYEDPYAESDKLHTPLKRQKHRFINTTEVAHDAAALPIQNQSQRPPIIFATRSLIPPVLFVPEKSSQPTLQFSQQPSGLRPESRGVLADPASSQNGVMLNTQVLAGPQGGRPLVKKKPAKKRIGGF